MNQAQAEAPAPRRFDDVVTFGALRAATDEELTAIIAEARAVVYATTDGNARRAMYAYEDAHFERLHRFLKRGVQ